MRSTFEKILGKFGVAITAVLLFAGTMAPFAQNGVADTVKVVQIAAAQNNSIALKSDGTVIAWGNNISTWAKPPEGLSDVVEIHAKSQLFLARKSNGTVVAWGADRRQARAVHGPVRAWLIRRRRYRVRCRHPQSRRRRPRWHRSRRCAAGR